MQRYLIPGLGIVDVVTDLHVAPGANNHGSHVVGTAKAWVRRLDNSFFQSLTGGLPSLTTNLERGNDGIVHLTNLQLHSPKLRLCGAGERFKDGTFHITAAGRQAKYGPVKMVLDGHIERPRLQLFLQSPNEALGITDMRLALDPDPGWVQLPRQRRFAPRSVHQQRTDPAAARCADRHRHRRARRWWRACQRRPQVGFRRLRRTPDARQRHARGNARLLACRSRSADRCARHRKQRRFPRSVCSAHRPRRRGCHPRRGSNDDRGQRRCAWDFGGRGLPCAPDREREADQWHRPNARGVRRPPGRGLHVHDTGGHRSRYDQAHRQRADREPAAHPQPGRDTDPLGRRLGACPDERQLRRRPCDRVRTQRLRSRSARAAQRDAAADPRPVLAEARPLGLCDRQRRLCLEEQPQRSSRP